MKNRRRLIAGALMFGLATGAVAPIAAANEAEKPPRAASESSESKYNIVEDGPVHLGGKDGKPDKIPDNLFWAPKGSGVFTYDAPKGDDWKNWFRNSEDATVEKVAKGKDGQERYAVVAPNKDDDERVIISIFQGVDLDKHKGYQKYLKNGGEEVPEGARAFHFDGFHDLTKEEGEKAVEWYKENSGIFRQQEGKSEEKGSTKSGAKSEKKGKPQAKSEEKGKPEAKSEGKAPSMTEAGIIHLGKGKAIPSEYNPEDVSVYVSYDGNPDPKAFGFKNYKTSGLEKKGDVYLTTHRTDSGTYLVSWAKVPADEVEEYREHMGERGHDLPKGAQVFYVSTVSEEGEEGAPEYDKK